MFIVSFATPTYEVEAYTLLEDLRALNIPHEVHFIEGLHNWNKNNSFKPTFLREMLLKHKRPVIWLDSDSEIRKYPSLFEDINDDGGYDIAYHLFNGVQLCGGVLYFNNTPRALQILDAWIEANEKNSDDWDQANLQGLLPLFPEARIFKLPAPYCCFDLQKDQSDPVIWSRQASRRLAEGVK